MSEKGKLNFNKFKTLIIAIVIVIIVIILDIIFENYSRASIKKVNGNVEKIYSFLKEQPQNNNYQDYEKSRIENLALNARSEWKKREKILSCFVEHDEVEKIEIKLDILYMQTRSEQWGDVKSTTAELTELIKYLEGKYKLSVQNIF